MKIATVVKEKIKSDQRYFILEDDLILCWRDFFHTVQTPTNIWLLSSLSMNAVCILSRVRWLCSSRRCFIGSSFDWLWWKRNTWVDTHIFRLISSVKLLRALRLRPTVCSYPSVFDQAALEHCFSQHWVWKKDFSKRRMKRKQCYNVTQLQAAF